MTKQVFLLSDKSSGSTIFQSEFLQHSSARAVAWSHHNESETLFWVKAASLVGFRPKDFLFGRPPAPPKLAGRLLTELLRQNVAPDWPEIRDRLAIHAAWTALAEQHAPCFFEKSPHHLNQWPAIATLLTYLEAARPDYRLVAMVRNPLDVIYSTYRRWSADCQQRQFQWLATYRNLLALQQLVDPQRVLVVRYEDMIAEPHAFFRRICEFTGVDGDAEMGSSIHDSSRMKWKSDPEFGFHLADEVATLAGHLGYARDELVNPTPARAPSAREQLAHRLRRVRLRVGTLRRLRRRMS